MSGEEHSAWRRRKDDDRGMRTIGLIGSGDIGSTVARLAVAAGHDVVPSNSHGPQTLQDLVSELGPKARAATPRRPPRLARPLPNLLAHRRNADRRAIHQEPVPALPGPHPVRHLPRQHPERGLSPARTPRLQPSVRTEQ